MPAAAYIYDQNLSHKKMSFSSFRTFAKTKLLKQKKLSTFNSMYKQDTQAQKQQKLGHVGACVKKGKKNRKAGSKTNTIQTIRSSNRGIFTRCSAMSSYPRRQDLSESR